MPGRFTSKIATTAGRRPGLGSFGDLGPGSLALGEWAALGLELPDVDAMRGYRLGRVRSQLELQGFDAGLFYDPINLRYLTDSTNMSVWTLHNPARYVLVVVDGPVVLFDFHGSEHLSAHLPLIDEVRHGRTWFYFDTGDNSPAAAEKWAVELIELLPGRARLAVDRLDPLGTAALEGRGVTLGDGQAVMELSRAIKSDDEIQAMRCSIATTQTAINAMRSALSPGISEQELWSILHRENIARGGEWIETRLLSSGQRTNPWYQECSSRVIEEGDLVAFDTDLIGPYGYCTDLSRTWLCGDGEPTDRQRGLYRLARDQIEHNIDLLGPGVGFLEFASAAFQLPVDYRAQRYSFMAHGVGLCDEYPGIVYPEDAAFAYDGVFVPNMTVCVESYIGEVGGPDGIKLEQQVLITETGAELLTTYPWDDRLSG